MVGEKGVRMPRRQLSQDELLSCETIVADMPADVHVELSAFNLRSAGTRNWGGTELILGTLHLTNYRLVFCTNTWQRVEGNFSIFLSTILEVKNTSFFLGRSMEVHTDSHVVKIGFTRFTGIPAFIARIVSTRDSIDAESRNQLLVRMTEEYPKLGEGLRKSESKGMRFLEAAIPVIHFLEPNPLKRTFQGPNPPKISDVVDVLKGLGGKKQ
jgi:hypothetical protein